MATRPEPAFYSDFLQKILDDKEIKPVFAAYSGIEATLRQKGKNSYLFLISHNTEPAEVIVESAATDILTGKTYHAGDALILNAYGVAILES